MTRSQAVADLIADITNSANQLPPVAGYADASVERDLRLAAETLDDALTRLQVMRHTHSRSIGREAENGTHTAGPSSMPCPDPSLHYAPVEDSAPLARVTLDVCQACLKGDGGECHTPGCAFWMSRAPDVPLGIVPNQTADCPWCGEPLEVSEGTDGVCPNGHEWWEEIDAD